jgi:hypothetical protein
MGRGVPFFAEKENIDILSNFGHFGAQNVPKSEKNSLKRAFWGGFSWCFFATLRNFSRFCSFVADFVLFSS